MKVAIVTFAILVGAALVGVGSWQINVALKTMSFSIGTVTAVGPGVQECKQSCQTWWPITIEYQNLQGQTQTVTRGMREQRWVGAKMKVWWPENKDYPVFGEQPTYNGPWLFAVIFPLGILFGAVLLACAHPSK